jgi:hypothetical protein
MMAHGGGWGGVSCPSVCVSQSLSPQRSHGHAPRLGETSRAAARASFLLTCAQAALEDRTEMDALSVHHGGVGVAGGARLASMRSQLSHHPFSGCRELCCPPAGNSGSQRSCHTSIDRWLKR